jgi:transcriptional regulator with XRE-family HTH domain
MDEEDLFEGLGKALALFRIRAGYATQTDASERLGFDKGQLSRWENESPRPTLDNLSRLLTRYRVSLKDLVNTLEEVRAPKRKPFNQLAYEMEMARLNELIRQMEKRQREAETRIREIEAKEPPPG